MKPTLFVATTALIAMPWLAGAQDAGRRPTANNPAIAPDQLRPLGSRLAQAGPQPPDPDSATRRVRTIILRSDARTKDAPAQSDRPPAEGPHNERRAEIPSSHPPSRFRQIYFCDRNNPASASALGEITDLQTVTVVGPGGKSAAAVKEILPEEMFLAGTFRGTRLELAPGAPCSAAALAILTPAETVEVVPVEETKDASAITRVADYLELRSRDGIPAADEQPDVYLTNYQMTDAKVFALPPNYTAVLAHVTHDVMVRDVIHQKYESEQTPTRLNRCCSLSAKESPSLPWVPDRKHRSVIASFPRSRFRIACTSTCPQMAAPMVSRVKWCSTCQDQAESRVQ